MTDGVRVLFVTGFPRSGSGALALFTFPVARALGYPSAAARR